MKKTYNFLFSEFKVAILFLRNLLAVRGLSVGEIKVVHEEQHERYRTDLYWHARGCHRIKIIGHGAFPGNIKGVSVLTPDSAGEIHFIFKGINNVIRHKIRLQPCNRDHIHQFSAFLSTPEIVSSSFHTNYIENGFTGIQVDCDFSRLETHVNLKGDFTEYLQKFINQQTNVQ